MTKTNYMTWIAAKLVITTILVSACGSNPESNNYGYGFNYDVQSEATGLRLRYQGVESTIVGRTPADAISWFDAVYALTMKCTGLSAPAPLVIVLPKDAIIGYRGYAYFDTNTALITTVPDFQTIMQHEFVHLLLAANGYDSGANTNHESPLFAQCAGGPLSYNE